MPQIQPLSQTWKIGYRFNDRTGTERPWEVVCDFYDNENSKHLGRRQWSSFGTEAKAAASIPASIARMSTTPSHMTIICENLGRIEQ